MRATAIFSTLSILLFASIANAGTYNEAVNGDISGDRAAPTVIPLDQGTNSLIASSMAGDIEYYTMTVPVGFRLTAINVASYANGNLSFIAVQRGTTFTEPPTGTTVGNLLGYSHFGSGNSTIGTDILDNIGTGAGSQGFVGPLGPGTYTFWTQETGGVAVSYTLNFQLSTAVPAVPRFAFIGMAAALGLLGAVLVGKTRRSGASA
jgi:hypothetical protein